MALELRSLAASDTDLAAVAAQLNASDSEVSIKEFTEDSLKNFLSDPSRLYIVAHEGGELAGAVHGYVMLHPAGVKYFYVDELDTVGAHRRHGVATALMAEISEAARQLGCTELWLGTEDDNTAANTLYQKLGPSETEHGSIYTYRL
jgi:aminoglycoside 6'-N-acetyltransferase I